MRSKMNTYLRQTLGNQGSRSSRIKNVCRQKSSQYPKSSLPWMIHYFGFASFEFGTLGFRNPTMCRSLRCEASVVVVHVLDRQGQGTFPV